MSRPPSIMMSVCAALALLSARADALVVRGYAQSLHNRLLDFPGAPVYPQVPVINPGFAFADAAKFRGIGWPAHPTDWTRQMALVSPRHFLYATHYPLGADWQIAFLGTDGQQHLFGIESQTAVINTLGQTTDLMVCTLSSEVETSTGITPFSVLNLSSEAQYTGAEMIVGGSFVRLGKNLVDGFTTLVNDPGFDTTRFVYFDYDNNGGPANECHYEGGDSGAPIFIMDANKPALIATASGWDPPGWGALPANVSRSYGAFVPAYLPQVDALMEAKGYHLIRSRPAPATLQVQTQAVSPLRRMKPGSIRIQVQNTGPNEAHNLSLSLGFSAPTPALTCVGSICEASGPAAWKCRKGGIPAAGEAVLTASWNQLPNAASVDVSVVRTHDGAATQNSNLTIPLIESFTSWIQGAADTRESADPDKDGLSNLLEYAFGGAHSAASAVSPQGHPLRVLTRISGNEMILSYARRSDAAARGLVYQMETSATSLTDSWSAVSPPGVYETTAPFAPASAGFEQVNIHIPVTGNRRFARVRVTLTE